MLIIAEAYPQACFTTTLLLLSVKGINPTTSMPVLAVVDDDPLFHYIVKRLNLKFSTFSNILSYKNGSEFINYLKHNGHSSALLPDSVLIDVHMPGLSGWMVLDKLGDIYNTLSKKYPYLLFQVPFIKVINYGLNNTNLWKVTLSNR